MPSSNQAPAPTRLPLPPYWPLAGPPILKGAFQSVLLVNSLIRQLKFVNMKIES